MFEADGCHALLPVLDKIERSAIQTRIRVFGYQPVNLF